MKGTLYLKGLHGIRAIAAIAVVISHSNQSLLSIGLQPQVTLDIAGFGVTMFFALSGFLITYLLLIEKKENGFINVKHFYIRRILRIWPLYFLYLSIAIITFYFYLPENINLNLIGYALFVPNIFQVVGGGITYIGHFWSLGVEEHFYAFWPWLFRKSKNSIINVSLFLVAYFLLRVICWYLDRIGFSTIPYLAVQVNRFDCMAMGALGACLFYRRDVIFLNLVFSKVTQIFAWFILALLTINQYHIASLIDHQVISLVTLVIIINGIANRRRLISLENKVMTFLGKISFGIYVYHPLLIFLFSFFSLLINRLELVSSIKVGLFYSLVLSSTILISFISYSFFEKKFLLMKTRFSILESSLSKSEMPTIITKANMAG